MNAIATVPFLAPVAEEIWDMKYRFKDEFGEPIDDTVEDTWHRIALTLAKAESPRTRRRWLKKFIKDALEGFRFLPAGRIVAGAGTGRNITLSNCFTMGVIGDGMRSIFEHLMEAALTMQQGGGIGYDFSPLRPKGAPVKGVGADASGPLSFMDVWDAMCRTVMSAGSRRGAMMATMHCTHPDIEDFIKAKQDKVRLRMFNLSVLVSDDFMEAVKNDWSWSLYHKSPPALKKGETAPKVYAGNDPKAKGEFLGYVYRTMPARELWQKIMRATYDYAEPGVIFIDRINRDHNINYIEKITTTNPCGEKPMGPYASCLLGSINLTRFVSNPFGDPVFEYEAMREVVVTAIRMMDNVVDVGGFPLPEQLAKAQADRQLGLGVTGLADALVMMGMTYGEDEAVAFTELVMKEIAIAAYGASINLAAEKGSFPNFDADKFLAEGHFVSRMPDHIQDGIRNIGIRNALLLSIAPTGTISLYAGNISSGIEPIFARSYKRTTILPDQSKKTYVVEDYAVKAYREWWLSGVDQHGNPNEPDEWSNDLLPACFVDAQTLSPMAHLRMQAAAQKWVDSSISKTINLPREIPFDDFSQVYMDAWDMGCKGCTTYRPNDVTGSILEVVDDTKKVDDQMRIPVLSPGTTIKFTEPHELLDRPDELEGTTYKIKFGSMEHAVYVIINHIAEEGGFRPFEIFFNTKDLAHHAWMTGMSRMISAVFRRPHDSSFVVQELKDVFDPTFSGFWQVPGSDKARSIPSVLAAIGYIIERHMQKIGYIGSGPTQIIISGQLTPEVIAAMEAEIDKSHVSMLQPGAKVPFQFVKKGGPVCPRCGSTNLKHDEGCTGCIDCLWSKCA